MTKEELAEEYADRTRIVDENTKAGTDCISLVQDYEGNVIDIHQRIKTAFLAGLKTKTQWHDLRKNPDDLPEDCTTVLAIDNLDDKEISLYHFVCSDHWEWLPRQIAVLSNNQIKKWCEIPKE